MDKLHTLKLDVDSTLIEVSDYIRAGGLNGDEWPWKVMTNSRSPGDKWITGEKDGTGWIVYNFDKPITFRGYGLVSANDADDRDPTDWTMEI